MNIDANIELININTLDELLKYYPGISELFLESFGKPLDKKLWEWAYIENPFGEPLVSVALYNDKVVGHYAVIPMNLENESSSIFGYLSMTTMVAVDYRRHRLFQRLAEMVYERIDKTNLPSIVFGFPNDNSAPGFIKRLGWSISEDYKVVCIKPEQLNKVSEIIKNKLAENCFTLNMNSSKISDWRTSKPNQTWVYDQNIGIKKIGEEFDLMHISDIDSLNSDKYTNAVNMILPLDDNSPLSDEIKISFPYRFGYRVFNTMNVPNIFVQMSMSDIF